MSFRCHTYATEAEALRAIAAIDAARPATETVRNMDTGQTRSVPTKPWATKPIPLADGTFAVPWDARLLPVEGRAVRVNGENVSVALDATAVTRQRTDVRREAVAAEPSAEAKR